MMRAVLVFLMALLPGLALAAQVRLKDIADFDGVRGNDLVGYGLVVGLNGSGDSLRNSPFTEEIMKTLLERMGVNISNDVLRSKNVAAVIVTGVLPPFARTGSKIDVHVATIGDAKSLLGGTLVMTPLSAADGDIYAVAQGPVLASGAAANATNASVVTGVPTAGTIPNGARVEREVNFSFADMENIRIALRSPDFTTAMNVEKAVNAALGRRAATALDSGTVLLDFAPLGSQNPASIIGRIENVSIHMGTSSTVVIDDRSGTIVLGDDVRISKVAVSQGGLTVKVQDVPVVSQPNPFSQGETVVVAESYASITEDENLSMTELSGETSLAEVVSGLNSLGVTSRDLIDILKALHAAGALHADVIIQ